MDNKRKVLTVFEFDKRGITMVNGDGVISVK